MAIFEIKNIHKGLKSYSIQEVQDYILENGTVEFDLESICKEFKLKLYNFRPNELETICTTAIENLLEQGKIKVGSSIGNFIVVQPINDIEQETEAKTDNEIGS